MTKKQTLGEILVQKRLVTQEQLEAALRIQTSGDRRLGHILIKMGVITDDQLLEALSDQHDIPLCNIDREFNSNAINLVPRYLCRKYSVFPVAIENNNVLKLAMVNPLDGEAISDIDHYTGKVVQAVLAKQKDITNAIRRHIPFNYKDFYYPFIYSQMAKYMTGIILALLLVVGILTYRSMQIEKYGSVSESGNAKIYYNHEIMVGVEGEGVISLIGHGPFARGFYSVVFNNPGELKTFIEGKKSNFTEKQYNWLLWVSDERLTKK
ncbi:MAG: hypothetical protein HQK79_18785 [Desulfobacterales bacterium]|nr:hypothetical protein [Desulfobacterales bacterium]MBF0396152.1 hypothetical protein [Desulfobacterales bacterium]